ncbi:MAG: P-loop NTPase [Metallosphaera sp.]
MKNFKNVGHALRISIQSAKGGVGKSTISMNLSLALAEIGKKVILLDRDSIGFSSKLSGIEKPGLLSSVVDGIDFKAMSVLRYKKGLIKVIKLTGDGPRFKDDLSALKESDELQRKFVSTYRSIITSSPHDYFIIDNPSLITNNNELAKLEVNLYAELFPSVEPKRIYVTTNSIRAVEHTVNYMVRAERSFSIGSALGFCINMVPPGYQDEAKEIVEDVVSKYNLKLGVVIEFNEEIYQYSDELIKMPILSQVRRLASTLDKGSGEGKITI